MTWSEHSGVRCLAGKDAWQYPHRQLRRLSREFMKSHATPHAPSVSTVKNKCRVRSGNLRRKIRCVEQFAHQSRLYLVILSEESVQAEDRNREALYGFSHACADYAYCGNSE